MNARALLLLLVVALCGNKSESLAADAPARTPPGLRLTGLINLFGTNLALIQMHPERGAPLEFMLGAGERDGEIELLKIDETAGTAKIQKSGEIIELVFDAGTEPVIEAATVSSPTAQSNETIRFRFQKARPKQILALYQSIANRSLLRSTHLPDFEVTLRSQGNVTAEDFLKAIESALASKRILFRAEREKFVLAGREEDLGKVGVDLWKVAEHLAARSHFGSPARPAAVGAQNPGSNEQDAATEEIVPAGFIDLRGTHLIQVLMLFQELVNRTIIRGPALADSAIVFRSYTPLKTSEVIFAFTALFALDNLSVAPVGEKFVMVFPTFETNKAAAVLAKSEPAIVASGKEPLKARTLDFRGAALEQLAPIYQGLCGCSVEWDPSLRTAPIILTSQTELTYSEALQGLNLLLAWHQIDVVKQAGGNSLSFVRSK